MTDVQGPDWTFEQWLSETRAVRDALTALGVTVPHCLAGEPHDCGESVSGHYATYIALLRARTDELWENNLDTEHGLLAGEVYRGELAKWHAEAQAEEQGR